MSSREQHFMKIKDHRPNSFNIRIIIWPLMYDLVHGCIFTEALFKAYIVSNAHCFTVLNEFICGSKYTWLLV